MRARRPVRWTAALAALAALVALVAVARPVGMAALRGLVAVTFRDVPVVSTAELASELAAAGRPRLPPLLLLLDARSGPEYAVSHLPGARHAPAEAEAGWLAALPRDTPIVTYCSVGWRSAGLARRLRARGFTSVRNLEGSAFAWANEGRALAGRMGARGQVHPYSTAFAFLLVPAARGPAW